MIGLFEGFERYCFDWEEKRECKGNKVRRKMIEKKKKKKNILKKKKKKFKLKFDHIMGVFRCQTQL
jgi:uncharacterized protein YaaW (UPF0174 family)